MIKEWNKMLFCSIPVCEDASVQAALEEARSFVASGRKPWRKGTICAMHMDA